MSHIKRNYHQALWQDAVSSSGTLRAIETLITTAWWPVSIAMVTIKLRKNSAQFRRIDDIEIPGLSETPKVS